jgi:hypothetical protein
MTKNPRREAPTYGAEHLNPPYVPSVKRPGDEGSAFRQAPLAEPKAERQLLAVLGTNGAVMLMGGLLVIVVVVSLAAGTQAVVGTLPGGAELGR